MHAGAIYVKINNLLFYSERSQHAFRNRPYFAVTISFIQILSTRFITCADQLQLRTPTLMNWHLCANDRQQLQVHRSQSWRILEIYMKYNNLDRNLVIMLTNKKPAHSEVKPSTEYTGCPKNADLFKFSYCNNVSIIIRLHKNHDYIDFKRYTFLEDTLCRRALRSLTR